MANLNGFNAETVDPGMDFEPVPAGKYLAVISKSEMKPTKAGNGSFLELEFDVIEGQYQNRKLWARLNLDNPNETAVKISRGQLSSICRSLGVMQPKDSAELHDKPLTVKVRCRQRPDNGEIVNEISSFSKPETVGVPGQSDAPPWRRG